MAFVDTPTILLNNPVYLSHVQSVQMNTFSFPILPLHVSAVNNHLQRVWIQVQGVSRMDHIAGERVSYSSGFRRKDLSAMKRGVAGFSETS